MAPRSHLVTSMYEEILSFRAYRQRIRRRCRKEKLTFKSFFTIYPEEGNTFKGLSQRYNYLRDRTKISSEHLPTIPKVEEMPNRSHGLQVDTVAILDRRIGILQARLEDSSTRCLDLNVELLSYDKKLESKDSSYKKLLNDSKVIREKAIKFKNERDSTRLDLEIQKKTSHRIIMRFMEFLDMMRAPAQVISRMREGFQKIADHELSRDHLNPVR